MNEVKLLSCPFCGGEAEEWIECEMIKIRCSACGAQTVFWFDEIDEAVKEWNCRTPQAQLDREGEPNGWISVEDRLPSEDDVNSPELGVLAIHKASKRRYYHYRSVVDNSFDFTHWMPLPQPPKEERQVYPIERPTCPRCGHDESPDTALKCHKCGFTLAED